MARGTIRGGTGSDDGFGGSDGTITGRECPKGLHGIFCEVRFAPL